MDTGTSAGRSSKSCEPNIKVTVGLCVKNAEATIKQAIDSILKQDFSYKLMELITVDVNSEDRTLSIIEKGFAQVNIRIRIFQESKGLGFARQNAYACMGLSSLS